MDNTRLLLLLSLGAILFLIYQAWMQDYGQPTEVAPVEQTLSNPETTDRATAPPVDAPNAPSVTPSLPQTAAETMASSTLGDIIQVETDVLRAEISTQGGTLQSLWLKDYDIKADEPGNPVRLFKPDAPNMFVAQTGLIGSPEAQLPTHRTLFTTDQLSYELGTNQDELTVSLRWADDKGLEVIKRYRFTRGRYVIDSEQEVINNSGQPIAVRDYDQLQRTEFIDPNGSAFIHTYTGGVYYGPEVKYKKESFKEMTKDPLDLQITNGWIAMIQHYFLAAWVPPRDQAQTFYTKTVDNSRYIIGQYSPSVTVPVGASHVFDNQLFAGPKLQDRLEALAPGLELAVDYGWLTVIAKPIFWLLDQIYRLVGNWGWAIIILTVLIKAAFYKLSETSYKSMANMRKVAPRLKALKDRYGDDKERLNAAMMEMYKKEKINPLGGCLPILVQIPVFIALYWVLLESVELRHAPFIFWLDNLTAPDPYYVLPLIMGISMFVQQKLNPPPPDPIQAKVFMALPFVFTVFFAFFPSGLVLYWTVNQLLSIAQQGYITHKIDKADAGRKKN